MLCSPNWASDDLSKQTRTKRDFSPFFSCMMVIMFAAKSVFNLTYLTSTQTIDKDVLGLGQNKMEHFTLIWNTFVFLQVFNLINCRDVSSDGRNGFSGLHRNYLTVLIILLIIGIQFLSCFTFLGRIFFEAAYTGGREWMVTIVAAASVLLANALLKFVPESIFAKAQLDEAEPIGGTSVLLRAYSGHAKGKFIKPKGEADGMAYEPPVSVDDADRESNEDNNSRQPSSINDD